MIINLTSSKLFEILKSLFKNSCIIFIIISFSTLLSSCARYRHVSVPLLTELRYETRIEKPIVENAIIITVRENPQLRTRYKLEENLKGALRSGLKQSNIFGHNSSRPFAIYVYIKEWDMPSSDIGMFASKMRTKYVLFDEEQKIILDDEIYTEACSNEWFFGGHKRALRSVSVSVSKNVNEFIDILKSNLETKYRITNEGEITNKSILLEELKNLSELHSSGSLTDDEFKKAKEKLLNER